MTRFDPRPLALCVLSLTACDPSDLRAWVEGNRDIPERWDAFIPESAREDLIDAELSDDTVTLRYHEGEWSALVSGIATAIGDQGYTRIGTCPSSSGAENGSVALAKLTGGGKGELVTVRLSMLIKDSGHFFLEVRRGEVTGFRPPEGCTMTEESAALCDDSYGDCSFKSPE